MTTVEAEARRALNRLHRGLEKVRRELMSLRSALREAEGSDFPEETHRAAEERVDELLLFAEEEAQRLQEKILRAGGLEPGRVRRSSST